MEGESLKNAIKNSGRTVVEIAEITGISRDTIYSLFKREQVPLKYVDKLREIGISFQRADRVKKPANDNLSMVRDGNVMHVPLVNQYAYAGYLSGYSDNEYVDELPHVPFLVDKEYHGNYVCFEVRGDSMDDGSRDSYSQGDVVLCREIQRDHWRNPLHINKWDFVIVHDESIVIKRILQHDTDKGKITVHSLNPLYKDYTIKLAHVKQLFNVIKHTKSK